MLVAQGLEIGLGIAWISGHPVWFLSEDKAATATPEPGQGVLAAPGVPLPGAEPLNTGPGSLVFGAFLKVPAGSSTTGEDRRVTS